MDVFFYNINLLNSNPAQAGLQGYNLMNNILGENN